MIETTVYLVSQGRCPLCATRLHRVVCKCVRGSFFTKPKLRPHPHCPNCGGYGSTRQCPLWWAHKLIARLIARGYMAEDAHASAEAAEYDDDDEDPEDAADDEYSYAMTS